MLGLESIDLQIYSTIFFFKCAYRIAHPIKDASSTKIQLSEHEIRIRINISELCCAMTQFASPRLYNIWGRSTRSAIRSYQSQVANKEPCIQLGTNN